jgi:hypothetical protein
MMHVAGRRVVSLFAIAVFALPASAAPLFRYYGGKVVSNAQVVQVHWTSAVDGTVQARLPAFWTEILDSAYIDWLSEYTTVGETPVDKGASSNQRIGRGDFVSTRIIVPSTTAKTLSNVQIRDEIARQIAAGHLPATTNDAASNVNTVYMVDFPPGYTITQGGATSCVDFCASYDTMTTSTGKSVGIGLFPDIATGACVGRCGIDPNPFNNVSALHAGQLIQIITDVEFPLVSSAVRPAAWFSKQLAASDSGNIADVCIAQPRASTPSGFALQTGWSNKLGKCIDATPTPLPLCDGTATYCRQCSVSDDGGACNGTHPVCQRDATSASRGLCIACTTDAQCTGHTTGPHCLTSGACGLIGTTPGQPGRGVPVGGPGGCSSTGVLPFAAALFAVFARGRRRVRRRADDRERVR